MGDLMREWQDRMATIQRRIDASIRMGNDAILPALRAAHRANEMRLRGELELERLAGPGPDNTRDARLRRAYGSMTDGDRVKFGFKPRQSTC